MPSEKNQQAVANLEAQLETSQAVFLADYSGLNVKAQQELREKVKAAGGVLQVPKNTLLKIALKNKAFDVDSIATELTGQNILLCATDDPIAPLKVMVDFAKEYEKPALKTGFLGTELLPLERLLQLADLPAKPELIARLLAQIQAPLQGMVRVLQAPTQNLLYTLVAVREKGETQ